MSELAPVVLFAWRRPDHLRRTLEALVANPQARATDLHVYCDGPRTSSQLPETDAVAKVLSEDWGFQSLRVVRRDDNMGLARNVISGVTEVVGSHRRAIVLEDDLVVSPSFLGWMNTALDRYADCPEVASIHGYSYPVRGHLPDSYFLRGADCWGWATWQRAWGEFESDGSKLLLELQAKGLLDRFDWEGAYGYVDMLRAQIEGRNDSWAVRWHASAFLKGMLTLYPGRSLVANIGHDQSGTHSGGARIYDLTPHPTAPGSWPERIEESVEARSVVREFLWKASGRRRPLMDRLRSWISLP